MSIEISVVICVYTEKRWTDILAAVASVWQQSLRAHETFVVVDHNPNLLRRILVHYAGDDTVTVLANTRPRGVSGGRNTGIAAAGGSVIAFLDDDAVADTDWLRHFADAYADPRVMAVGGRTVPAWVSGRRPTWFPREFDWVVGASYLGQPVGWGPVRNVMGGNASFRRAAFEVAGGFATGIGRDGDKWPLGCEDTEMCIRLQRAMPDALVLIDDRAVIRHRVPQARERFRYLCTRCYAEGLSKALVTRSVGTAAGLESEWRYTTRVLPAGLMRALLDTVRGRPGGAGRAGAIISGLSAAAAGYALGTLRARRTGGASVVPVPGPRPHGARSRTGGEQITPARTGEETP